MKFFSSKSSDCYKFENKLQISLENLVVKKEKQGTLLWNIFEWYGYSIYDLNGNVDSKNKVFELFDIPYLLNFGGGSVSGAENTLEMADFFNGVVLFKTMMFQNIKEHSKLQILKLYDYLSEIVAYLAMLVLLIFSFTDKFVDKREIEKKKIFFEFQNELKNLIENLPPIDEKLSNSVEKIQATEDNIFDLIFCRMNWREFKNLRDIFENKFDYLEKQEGTPTEIEYPKDLPNTLFNPSNILQDTQKSNCFGYFQPMIALPNPETGIWTAKENYLPEVENTEKLIGQNFIVNGDEVYSLKNGVQGNRISNVAISIKSIEHRWSGKKIKTFLNIVVSCSSKEKKFKNS